MSIQEIHIEKPPEYQLNKSQQLGPSYTLIDTVNKQAVTTILDESDISDEEKTKNDLQRENALLKRQLSQIQVSTYKESLSIIQHLTEKNMQLARENETLSHMLLAQEDKFNQLKTLVEPALEHVMHEVTENLVTKLMKRVPDLNEILLNSTKDDGTMNFQLLIEKLEAESEKEKKSLLEMDDDLSEWCDIVEYDLADAFKNSTSEETNTLTLTYNKPIVSDSHLLTCKETVSEIRTVIIPEIKETEFDRLINQLKLLKETYGETPSFHAVKTEDYIIINGEKLDKEGALSLLVKYTAMVGKGICVTGKSTFWMLGTIVQLASFVGLGISIFTSPWTAAFLLLGRFSYPVLRIAIGI